VKVLTEIRQRLTQCVECFLKVVGVRVRQVCAVPGRNGFVKRESIELAAAASDRQNNEGNRFVDNTQYILEQQLYLRPERTARDLAASHWCCEVVQVFAFFWLLNYVVL
jgi:hypothetical protein